MDIESETNIYHYTLKNLQANKNTNKDKAKGQQKKTNSIFTVPKTYFKMSTVKTVLKIYFYDRQLTPRFTKPIYFLYDWNNGAGELIDGLGYFLCSLAEMKKECLECQKECFYVLQFKMTKQSWTLC